MHAGVIRTDMVCVVCSVYHVHNQHVLYQLEISPAINSYKTLLRIGALLKLSTCLIFFCFDLAIYRGMKIGLQLFRDKSWQK